MKKILFVPFVLAIVLTVDLCYRYIGDYAYEIEPESKNYGFAYQNFSKKADLVIIGSSRAKHHYDCDIFRDSLGIETYNLGCDAYGILQQYLVLLRLIENGGTSTVIFDVTHKTLLDAFGWSDNNELNFIPYYWENDTLKYYMDEYYGRLHNLRYLSGLIQYNGKVKDIASNIKHNKENLYRWKNNGYDPIKYTGVANTDFRSDNIKDYTPSPICIQLLDNIVSLSRKNNIRLILMISPVVDDWTPFANCVHRYANKKNIEFYDFSQKKGISDNMYFFKDYHHLNSRGAETFTKEVIKTIKN